jgi:hypothetical protein
MSGLGVQGVKSLAFLKIFFGTAKPDIPEKTRQAARPENLLKRLIFSLIHPLLGYFSIPDTIAEASHLEGQWCIRGDLNPQPSDPKSEALSN